MKNTINGPASAGAAMAAALATVILWSDGATADWYGSGYAQCEGATAATVECLDRLTAGAQVRLDQAYEALRYYTENAASENCYSFALSSKEGVFGHPGAATGQGLKTLRSEDIREALSGDGLMPAEEMPPQARNGFYLVAAVAAGPTTQGRQGYHFYRQMEDGSWWHKPGKQEPTNLDADGKVIVDPLFAERDYTRGTPEGNPSRRSGYDSWQHNYNIFIGYFYAPDSGLPVAPGNLPDEVMESPGMRNERQHTSRQEPYDLTQKRPFPGPGL